MPLYQVVILAIVQGITEFLPISSSAHLALAPWLFGWRDQGLTFDIALHFGTLIAVLGYFFKDWVQVIAQAFGQNYGADPELRQNPSLLWLLAAGSIPAGIVGLLIEKYTETTLRSPYVIGTMLILIGLLMGYAERRSKASRGISHIGLTDSLAIGLSQALALIPGTSRSGITMTTALFRNFDRRSAARFSFLLSTPITAAACAKAAYDLYKQGGIPAGARIEFALGVLISGIVGVLVIAFLLRYLRNHSLQFFVYYRVFFGIIVIALAFFLRQPAG